jgi:hypothetical protein
MKRKKKYENAEIAKKIMERELNFLGDLETCLYFKFLDLKKKDDREFLSKNIKEFKEIFDDALKELEIQK